MKIRFSLEREQKLRLIEILLIVGSILTAFQHPTDITSIFMLFIIFSIIYFIFVQNKNIKTKSFLMYISSIMISASFSGLITYNYAVSLIDTYKSNLTVLGIIFIALTVYYIGFTYILTKVLTEE